MLILIGNYTIVPNFGGLSLLDETGREDEITI